MNSDIKTEKSTKTRLDRDTEKCGTRIMEHESWNSETKYIA